QKSRGEGSPSLLLRADNRRCPDRHMRMARFSSVEAANLDHFVCRYLTALSPRLCGGRGVGGRGDSDEGARCLAAIKSLAGVRNLALPVLQVNIDRKQVNVGACATRPGA